MSNFGNFTGNKPRYMGGYEGLRDTPFLGDDLYDKAGDIPSLDFYFASDKNLTDRASGKTSQISFSRSALSSPGTYVDSQGLIKKSAVNRVLRSEEFNQWTAAGGATVSANQVTA